MCASTTPRPPLEKHGVVHARPAQAGPQTPWCPRRGDSPGGAGPGTSWKHSKFQVGGGLRPSWSLGWLGLRAVTLTVTSKPRLCPPAPGVGGLVRGPGLKGSKPTGGSQAWALWASSGGLGGLGCSRSPDRGPWGPGSRSIVTFQGRSGLLDSSGLHLTATTLDLAAPGPLL